MVNKSQVATATAWLFLLASSYLRAQPDSIVAEVAAPPPQGESKARPDLRPRPPVNPRWKRLSPNKPVWIDKSTRTVIIGGEICHREGPLEMFACPRQTKEYESVVAVDCKAYVIHAALLAVAAKPGHPVEFDPEYRAAEGEVIDVFVEWLDEKGVHQRTRGQNWVKHLPTGKPMPYEWVFAGSCFWEDPDSGEQHYYAEGGELICVSNFSTAMLDLPVLSSQDNMDLQFAAFTENIPPEGTRVHLLLTPRIKTSPPESKP